MIWTAHLTIQHSVAKKPQKDSVMETIAGVAVTVAKVLKEPNTSMESQIET